MLSRTLTMLKNKLIPILLLVFIATASSSGVAIAQGDTPEAIGKAVDGLALRSIGPALMGGRIADIAVSPTAPSTWYVAAGSGNLWKTENSGITWQPVFDQQASYSIGTVTIDPNQPETIWVGTGENVSGRHVGWGDGVYRSKDAGKTWQQVGLAKSEHIGKILVDPRNSKVVLVAAEGPLWSSGGDRGVYKTKDGGETWELVLDIDENTGVTDLEFDPSNPEVIYAAAYQRRRHTWSLLAGGPNRAFINPPTTGSPGTGSRPACRKATWVKLAWRSPPPTRHWYTPPLRRTIKKKGSTGRRTRARPGKNATVIHPGVRARITTRRLK